MFKKFRVAAVAAALLTTASAFAEFVAVPIGEPADWEQQYSIYRGATFNLAHNLTQMLYFRPHNRFGRNVYLVGGGTHPGLS